MFIMKNLTDFHETVETGVDPPLDSDNYFIQWIAPSKWNKWLIVII